MLPEEQAVGGLAHEEGPEENLAKAEAEGRDEEQAEKREVEDDGEEKGAASVGDGAPEPSELEGSGPGAGEQEDAGENTNQRLEGRQRSRSRGRTVEAQGSGVGAEGSPSFEESPGVGGAAGVGHLEERPRGRTRDWWCTCGFRNRGKRSACAGCGTGRPAEAQRSFR